MTHTAFQERGHDVELSVDYVVVGSGAGGSMAAVTLARGGAEVAIVEAGPWRDPEDYPHSTYGALRDMLDAFGSTVTLGRANWPIVQGRLVGGSTVVNSAIAVRTPEDIFAQWRREVGVGGHALAEKVWSIQDRVEQELHVSEVPQASRGRSNILAQIADKKLQMGGHLMNRYIDRCEGNGTCLQGCRANRKQSTNINYIPETLRRGGHVLSCAPVAKVILEGPRAVGVRGRFVHPKTKAKGADFIVHARKGVLVSASVTYSSLLLRRSGVKNKNLGKGFRAHPGSGVFGVYDENIDMHVGATQGWASTKFRDVPGLKLETLSLPMEMVVSRFGGGGQELMARIAQYRHMAMWVQATRAQSVGSIASGPFGMPIVRYSLVPADMERFVEGIRMVSKMHFAAGARSIMPGIAGLPYELRESDLGLLDSAPRDPRAYVAILSHLFGGCVMGADPATSVCDGNGRVHGYGVCTWLMRRSFPAIWE
ncbi:MAG: GMC family oxidoreductase [Polyangiales bacterium]